VSDAWQALVCMLLSALLASSCRSPSSEAVLPPPRVRCVPAQTRSLADEIVLRGTVVPAPADSKPKYYRYAPYKVFPRRGQ
jgi:hypothetical protein